MPEVRPRQVPQRRVVELHARRSDYCVCVFVIDEGEKFHKQLGVMKPYSDSFDIVIADGGSRDGSTAPDVLAGYGVNTLLTKLGPGRLGTQMRMAFDWAIERGYRGVITIDGNNKDGPDALPRFAERLDAGFDHVQGSRYLPGGISENLPFSRHVAVKLLHAPLISLAAGFHYTDTTNGFRAYSARLLKDPRVDVFRDVFTGYELHYYLAIRAARLGFAVCEVPVARRYPDHGRIPTKISPIRGNLRVLRCLVAACLGRYNPS